MRTGGSFAYGAIVARPQKPATKECTAMFIFVRPPGLEPGSFGYKPRALTFELWAHSSGIADIADDNLSLADCIEDKKRERSDREDTHAGVVECRRNKWKLEDAFYQSLHAKPDEPRRGLIFFGDVRVYLRKLLECGDGNSSFHARPVLKNARSFFGDTNRFLRTSSALFSRAFLSSAVKTYDPWYACSIACRESAASSCTSCGHCAARSSSDFSSLVIRRVYHNASNSVPRVRHLLAYLRFPAGYILPEYIELPFVLGKFLFLLFDFSLCVLECELGGLKIPLTVAHLLGVPLRLAFQLRKLHRIHTFSVSPSQLPWVRACRTCPESRNSRSVF